MSPLKNKEEVSEGCDVVTRINYFLIGLFTGAMISAISFGINSKENLDEAYRLGKDYGLTSGKIKEISQATTTIPIGATIPLGSKTNNLYIGISVVDGKVEKIEHRNY